MSELHSHKTIFLPPPSFLSSPLQTLPLPPALPVSPSLSLLPSLSSPQLPVSMRTMTLRKVFSCSCLEAPGKTFTTQATVGSEPTSTSFSVETLEPASHSYCRYCLHHCLGDSHSWPVPPTPPLSLFSPLPPSFRPSLPPSLPLFLPLFLPPSLPPPLSLSAVCL